MDLANPGDRTLLTSNPCPRKCGYRYQNHYYRSYTLKTQFSKMKIIEKNIFFEKKESITRIGYVSTAKILPWMTCHTYFEPKNPVFKFFLRISKMKIIEKMFFEKTKTALFPIHMMDITTIGYVYNSKTLWRVTCSIHFLGQKQLKTLFVRVSKMKIIEKIIFSKKQESVFSHPPTAS